jgi:hypothetical protein
MKKFILPTPKEKNIVSYFIIFLFFNIILISFYILEIHFFYKMYFPGNPNPQKFTDKNI